MTTDRAQHITRLSERGAATRTALLMAAREIFLTEGYAQAGVTEIVTRAGASVGSLYHHFSGKAELYLALFEELHNDQARRTRHAVRGARGLVFVTRGSSSWWGREPTWTGAWSSGSSPRCSCGATGRPASTWSCEPGWPNGSARTPSSLRAAVSRSTRPRRW